ncbi:UNVERIFIED_ORG: hypothetical protein B2H98_06025 [Clostridium botulinum]
MNQKDKDEIKLLVDKYKIYLDLEFSEDVELKKVIENIKKFNNGERPDANYETEDYCYGIEHYQVSQYRKIKRNQDISKRVLGSQEHREKMKKDVNEKFSPSIDNLLKAIDVSLKSHAESFNIYKENVCKKYKGKEYRLIIFIEDSTEPAYIVKKKSDDNNTVNPLLIKEIAEVIIAYKSSLYGVIYSYGNEQEKKITGCTVEELERRVENSEAKSMDEYKQFEDERNVIVTKNKENDSDNRTITLCDFIGR